MNKAYSKRWRGAVAGALLGLSLAGCDFIGPTETNPNVVPDATLNQLLVAAQVLSYFWNEADNSRFPSVWMQQMDGTDRQFSAYSTYIFTNDVFDDPWGTVYTGGGLVDIRRSKVAAVASGNRVLAGIFQVHEAWFGGTMANHYGDIPWSQSTNPEITEPEFDNQLFVFEQIQTLLDEAIGNLTSGAGSGPAQGVDFNFDGDGAAWAAVAHSLKARYYMATAEVDAASYGRALAEARQGIQSNSGSWTAKHTTASTEHNIWNQFNRERTAYISAGAFLVDLLKERDDPRLEIYFTPGTSGEYEGSPPGEDDPDDPAVDGSQLNSALGSPGATNYPLPIITCSETRFIEAEAAFQTGDEAGARSALTAGIACQEDLWAVDIPDPGSLSGQALLAKIMDEKYIAQFLNPDTWSDYKRTCLPPLVGWRNNAIPARFLYPNDEVLTNTNTPPDPPNGRNANDPQGC